MWPCVRLESDSFLGFGHPIAYEVTNYHNSYLLRIKLTLSHIWHRSYSSVFVGCHVAYHGAT